MSIKGKLKRQDYAARPLLAWNALVSLLAFEEYEDLTPLQADASLLYWYDSEVQNGGHFQYFVNKAGTKAELAVAALGRCGATTQQQILSKAIRVWNSRSRPKISTTQQFSEEALIGEFNSLDRAYYECKPCITAVLQDVLNKNFAEFIELE